MIAIAVFPQKPQKGNEYLEDPKQVLEIDDSEVIKLTRTSRGVSHYTRHDDKLDNATDADMIQRFKDSEGFYLYESDFSTRKKGKGYVTTDKKYYIRIVRQPS